VKTIVRVMIVAGFTAVSLGAWSAELSDQDRTELRQRAQELQSQRARNPDFQPGEARSAVEPARMGEKRGKRAVKAHAAKTQTKEPLRKTAVRKARSLKQIPGAFVRK
jgi:hypothetical protein